MRHLFTNLNLTIIFLTLSHLNIANAEYVTYLPDGATAYSQFRVLSPFKFVNQFHKTTVLPAGSYDNIAVLFAGSYSDGNPHSTPIYTGNYGNGSSVFYPKIYNISLHIGFMQDFYDKFDPNTDIGSAAYAIPEFEIPVSSPRKSFKIEKAVTGLDYDIEGNAQITITVTKTKETKGALCHNPKKIGNYPITCNVGTEVTKTIIGNSAKTFNYIFYDANHQPVAESSYFEKNDRAVLSIESECLCP